MKNISYGYWSYNGCEVYLAEHPKLQGKYEIYKDSNFIKRAYSLKEAKQIIIEKYGKMSGGKRPLSGRKKSDHQTTTHTFRTRVEWMQEIKQLIKDKIMQLKIKSEKQI